MKEQSIQSYRDLKVWQEAMNLAELCYRVTKTFPKEETYGMTKLFQSGCKGVRVWGVRGENEERKF
ncbi:four helix bundle protein [Komarekiella sp. 'clone 1']|uniref:Four helix bundle protein n=1 Tax=Komarekiella delphini-convector SJRDD-AB1 TaxID=2593771 RepID=A0AA40VUT3_9NOST|nr:four helix bundle protein [Komarekiella delphini-convector]MBD6620475.1 four helix bundle protein [Komarekiella delphini-convector SJRDD-AB1]